MNWKQAEGQWDQIKGKVRTQWGRLTDDDLEQARGRRDRLVGKIRERYGETKEKIEERLDALIDKI